MICVTVGRWIVQKKDDLDTMYRRARRLESAIELFFVNAKQMQDLLATPTIFARALVEAYRRRQFANNFLTVRRVTHQLNSYEHIAAVCSFGRHACLLLHH